jgi:hypothetical protein
VRKKTSALQTAPGASNELRADAHDGKVRLILNSVVVAP